MDGDQVKGPSVRVVRVYEPRSADDGLRVLVDRVWPRGVAKATADLDQWCQAVAPSTELRTWYDHDPERFDEFVRRYRVELEEPERADALAGLRALARNQTLTLLTATKDLDRSQAAVLAQLIAEDDG